MTSILLTLLCKGHGQAQHLPEMLLLFLDKKKHRNIREWRTKCASVSMYQIQLRKPHRSWDGLLQEPGDCSLSFKGKRILVTILDMHDSQWSMEEVLPAARDWDLCKEERQVSLSKTRWGAAQQASLTSTPVTTFYLPNLGFL